MSPRYPWLAFAFGIASGACGLAVGGTSTSDAGAGVSFDAGDSLDATMSGDANGALDGAQSDAIADAVAIDAPFEASCRPFDAGLGVLALSAFTLRGNAAYNENGDGKITLTNSNNNERGAAWWPSPLPPLNVYVATFQFRVGPNDTAGDGIAFAVISSTSVPGVGDDGDGIGLRNLAGADGGVATGYAVIVDMYKSASDPTDLDTTTLKIATMPSFTVIGRVGISKAYNDGNVYSATVSWSAPGSIAVVMQIPGGGTATLNATDPGLATTTPDFVGFTAATGGSSDSHQEIASLEFTATCD